MLKKSKVLFKGKGSGLIVVIDERATYDEIKTELLEKVKRSRHFFKGASEDVCFEGKKLTGEQENEIIGIIVENSGLNVGFVNTESETIAKKSGTEMNPETSNNIKQSANNDIKQNTNNGQIPINFDKFLKNEDKVLIYHGFVRSGKLVESDENIIVIGGVNPGGEVFAGKNIVIFGQLKGKAVAGRSGARDSFIAAILMEPELLGIEGYVTRFPNEKKDKLQKTPSIARLEAGKIVIAPIGGK